MTRKLSDRGLDLIKEAEGLRMNAYRDSGGVLTIGYGHTLDVHEGDEISGHQAEVMLRIDVENAERCVNLRAPDVNQNQFDALVDFVFNLGCKAFDSSTLLRMVRKGDYNAAASQFSRWTHDNGKVLPGLVKRRNAEAKLFLTPDSSADFSNVESGVTSTAAWDEEYPNSVKQQNGN